MTVDIGDFSLCSVKIEFPNNTSEIEAIIEMKNGVNTKQYVLNHHLIRTVWAKVFKKVIDRYKIRFDTSLTLGEDTLFVLNFIGKIQNIHSISQPLYVYFKPNYSINKYNNTPEDLIYLYKKLVEVEKT
jgi:hypothetical protein